ncbi:hemolysin III [Kineosphaera limosa]|nr:hemolysin III family protein [Kineosphaera limosa]NYE02232.1 hemolysin III [Kineosphaera limosa]
MSLISRPTRRSEPNPTAAPAEGMRSHAEATVEDLRDGRFGDALDNAGHIVDAVKPHLRGWLHAGTFPLVLLSGLALVAATPTQRGRIGMAIFVATACLLFGTSALYHRGRWRPGAHKLLKRLDHANIFLIIAGTYSAFALTLLPPGQARTLLAIMWIAALGGVLFKVFWVSAPRWLSTPIYIALGWVAVFYIEPFYAAGGALVLALIILGGVLYTLGGVVYALRRPDPWPRWFGFHEIFHSLTIAAFAAHFVAAAILALRP